MEIEKRKAIIEAILFAAGREVQISEFMSALELAEDEIIYAINLLQEDYEKNDRGIEIVGVENSYQLASKKNLYEYLYPIFDKRSKPSLSQAALETLAIIAYNPKVTRAEIEAIRGVNSDGTIYKLLEYDLIESAGKLDAPGRPTTYKVTNTFLKMFGMKDLQQLPDLPRYKLDENQQLIIDDIIDNEEGTQGILQNKDINNESEKIDGKIEAPMPNRV